VNSLRWYVVLVLLLCGCGGGLGAAAADYLKKASPYQADLQVFQAQLRQIPTLPSKERKPAALALSARVRENKTKLQALEAPASVQRLHSETLELYNILEAFIDAAATGSGTAGDPKLKKLSSDWAVHLEALQAELQRLEARPN
jgi:hypothetical protein